MKGKVIVVTGASSGVGAAAARRLSAEGHHVVVVGRSAEKSAAVARALGTEFFLADFTRLAEARALADRLREAYPRIDVLANNAGCVSGTRRSTEDGHEVMFQVNHLAGFLLTLRLLDRLIASRGTVIFTSSHANKLGHVDLSNLEDRRPYATIKAYADSKLAQILVTRELHRRYGKDGLAAAAFHPGRVASRARDERGTPAWVLDNTPLQKPVPPEKAADTLVFLARSTPGVDFRSGEYFSDRRVTRPNRQAEDPALARGFWDRSEALIRDQLRVSAPRAG